MSGTGKTAKELLEERQRKRDAEMIGLTQGFKGLSIDPNYVGSRDGAKGVPPSLQTKGGVRRKSRKSRKSRKNKKRSRRYRKK